jgi:hypothetical protein
MAAHERTTLAKRPPCRVGWPRGARWPAEDDRHPFWWDDLHKRGPAVDSVRSIGVHLHPMDGPSKLGSRALVRITHSVATSSGSVVTISDRCAAANSERALSRSSLIFPISKIMAATPTASRTVRATGTAARTRTSTRIGRLPSGSRRGLAVQRRPHVSSR